MQGDAGPWAFKWSEKAQISPQALLPRVRGQCSLGIVRIRMPGPRLRPPVCSGCMPFSSRWAEDLLARTPRHPPQSRSRIQQSHPGPARPPRHGPGSAPYLPSCARLARRPARHRRGGPRRTPRAAPGGRACVPRPALACGAASHSPQRLLGASGPTRPLARQPALPAPGRTPAPACSGHARCPGSPSRHAPWGVPSGRSGPEPAGPSVCGRAPPGRGCQQAVGPGPELGPYSSDALRPGPAELRPQRPARPAAERHVTSPGGGGAGRGPRAECESGTGRKMGKLSLDVNIQEPRWDQSTFLGRARHFFTVTDPRNLLLSGAQLEAARNIVQNYRAGVVTPGLTEDQLWRAKHVYDSAFHPDTGEKVVLIGRMSAQVPMNMTITGCMLTFYRKTPTVVFWQWVNQSFNAVVNYSNRSGDAPVSTRQLGTAYVSATTGAVATALGLKSLTQHLPSLVGRFVPFAAVAAANCINIPLMRQRELQVGIPVTDEAGQRLGHSVTAARQGLFQVVISRIGMAIPAMAIPPVIMDALEKKDFLKCRPWLGAPLQVGLVGFCLVFATPLCCALFPQRSSIQVSRLEPELRAQIHEQNPSMEVVYYNKGL